MHDGPVRESERRGEPENRLAASRVVVDVCNSKARGYQWEAC